MTLLHFKQLKQTFSAGFFIIILFSSIPVHSQVSYVDTCRSPENGAQNMFEADWSVYDDNPSSG